MKKALLLVLAGLLAAAAPALAHPPAPANVNFSSERGVPFGLVLDGRPLTRGVARQVHVDRLMPGQHWADFTVPTAYGGAVRFRTRVWLEPGLETTFVLIARPGRPLDLRQVDAVVLCGPGHGYGPQGYGGSRYNSPTGYSPAPYGGQGGYGYNNYSPSNYGGNGYGNSSNSDDDDDDDDDNGYSHGQGNTPNNGGAGYYSGSASSGYRTLPPQEVNGLVQAVQQQRFESGKLSTAKEALGQNAIQSDDLKRLLQSLDFEASRVELAKFAYPHVVDPQNFSRVYDAFDFDTSAREVQQAVSNASQPQAFK